MAPVEARDTRPEELPHLVPGPRPAPPGDRQPKPRVQPPQAPPQRVRRDVELQVGERATGPEHASQLGQRRRGIVDVPQEVGEGHRVEGAAREGELLSLPRTKPTREASPAACTLATPAPKMQLRPTFAMMRPRRSSRVLPKA